MLTVTCPSGLKGVIRGLKVKDEQLFANKELLRTGRLITKVLESCWVETLDQGPYKNFDVNRDFSRLANADRTTLLIQTRIKTYGKDYEFSVTCGNCGYRYGWQVELDKLEAFPMSPEGISQLETQIPIPVKGLSEGLSVYIRVAVGEDDEFIAEQNTSEEQLLTYTLARKIVEINGKRAWDEKLPLVEDLDAGDSDQIWNESDAIEGGIDTNFDVKCPKCRNVQPVILPFEAGFFSNRKRFARSGKKKRG